MRTNQIIKQQKNKFLSFGAVILFNIALAGSLCGTFAWYTYATRTGFKKEYHGTTVGDLGVLQGGIISSIELPEYADYDLYEDKETLQDENKIIYWCPSKISADTINYVIGNNGSGTDSLNLVTTGSMDEGFNLLRAPYEGHNYITADGKEIAPSTDYVNIPFVFRYEDAEQIGHYLPNIDIYLSTIQLETDDDEHELYKTCRVYINNRTASYLINPSADYDGETVVGGVLDLSRDGYYDYNDSTAKEIIYGEYVSSADPYASEPLEDDTDDVEDSERTTFKANHKKGVIIADSQKYTPKTVSYKCMDAFSSRSIAISCTDSSYHNLAIANLYAFIEGWDLAAIDKEQRSKFNMNLKFEVAI